MISTPEDLELLNAVYAERNQCVALIARMAQFVGLRVGLRTSTDFEPGWQKCVLISLPTGQVSWHVKDSELSLFNFPDYPDAWDRHSTEEKYKRVNAAFQIDQAQYTDIEIDVTKIMADAKLKIALAALATDLLRNTPDSELSAEHLALKQQIDQAEAGQPEHNDQAQASQPEQRGHAPAPTTWHIDLTNMDSQAPAPPLANVVFDHSIPQD